MGFEDKSGRDLRGLSNIAQIENENISYDKLGYILLEKFEKENKATDVDEIIWTFIGEDVALRLPNIEEEKNEAIKSIINKINTALSSFNIKLEVYKDSWSNKFFVKRKS